MLRPRVTRAPSAAAVNPRSSLSSSLSADGEAWSPTIANPSLSAFERLKEHNSCEGGYHNASRSVGGGVLRDVSAGPLDLQDLVLLEPIDGREESGDALETEPQDQEYDENEEEDDDEDALKALFFRQQQLEKSILQQGNEPQEQHDDVDQFLTSELRFDLPASASNVPVASKKNKKNESALQAVSIVDPSMSALTASMHEQLSIEGSHHRRRQSHALLPDGVLHLWIYQAHQLSFRSHFESMYDRHGLHLRCYLSWRREYLSDVYESRRNVGGNMKNPVWRREDDHARNLMRGHFSIPLGSRSSPASLPANTEVVIEIVCGILVVSSAKVSLLEFFQDRTSKSSTEDDDVDYEQNSMANAGGIVSCSPQWYPLIGQDPGLLEMGLEFVPVSAFDDDDGDSEEMEGADNLAFVLVENNNEDDASSLFQDDDDDEAEPQVQDPFEPNAFEEEYMQLEQRTLTRKMRFENPELRDQYDAIQAQQHVGVESDSEISTSGDVVVSNNGKTTMYIPSQCQSNHVGFPLQQVDHHQLTTNSPSSTSLVVHEAAGPAQLLSGSPQPRADEFMMDEQVLDLFRFGIANNDQPSYQNDRMHRTSSCASQVSQFSCEYSEYSQSMFSRKASTCATDVLAYNELIQDMESSLETQAAQEQQLRGGRRSSPLSSSSVIRKADGILRLAAPTSEPHPITAAMGVIPNKSSLKKTSSIRTYGASRNDDEQQFEDDDYHHQASSVRETTPKGVVLFDLKSIPERLRVGFERSVSEERMTGNKKTDMNLGRRRSLPVNSLSSSNASQPVNSNATATSRGSRGRVFRPLAIDEHSDERTSCHEASQELIVRRKRSSSMHSLTDLQGRERDEAHVFENGVQRQQQHGKSRGSARNTPRTARQRRSSNTSSLVNVGGAVLGVGKFINVGSVPGVVRYVGPVNFATGTWIGIELCEKKGKNNGTVKGVEVHTLVCLVSCCHCEYWLADTCAMVLL